MSSILGGCTYIFKILYDMKRFIKNMMVLVLSVPTILLMFSLLLWSMLANCVAIFMGDFKPYKLLDILNDLFYAMERKIFH